MKRWAAAGLVVAAGCAAAGDASDRPLAPSGDAARGRRVFVEREQGHCVICHRVDGIRPAGDFGPELDGVGARLTVPQLRQRVIDITQVKPDAAMPAFHRREGLNRVAAAHVGKTLLDGQQVEDVVAFLGSLK